MAVLACWRHRERPLSCEPCNQMSCAVTRVAVCMRWRLLQYSDCLRVLLCCVRCGIQGVGRLRACVHSSVTTSWPAVWRAQQWPTHRVGFPARGGLLDVHCRLRAINAYSTRRAHQGSSGLISSSARCLFTGPFTGPAAAAAAQPGSWLLAACNVVTALGAPAATSAAPVCHCSLHPAQLARCYFKRPCCCA
jgi:hypothetical protein